MTWPVCNTTLEDMEVSEVSMDDSHAATVHQVLVLMALICTVFAVVFSFFQVALQTWHYQRPSEQKAIIRILLMVPIYGTSNFLAIYFYLHAVYWNLLANAYAAIGLASFYQLLISYIAPDLHTQKEYFKSVNPRPWGWPVSWLRRCTRGELGPFRTPRSGLTFFNITFVGVYQYCFVLILSSVAAAILQYFNRYCQSSLHPAFGHIWLISLNTISAVVSGYCLSQLHAQIKKDVREHKTVLKKFCVDVVLYLSTFQSLFFSLLVNTFRLVPSTERFQAPDWTIGLPSTLLCFEMGVVATVHLWAYNWRSYVLVESGMYHGGFLGIKGILHALNIWDLVKAVGRSIRWTFYGRRTTMDGASHSVALVQEQDTNGSSVMLLADIQEPAKTFASRREYDLAAKNSHLRGESDMDQRLIQ